MGIRTTQIALIGCGAIDRLLETVVWKDWWVTKACLEARTLVTVHPISSKSTKIEETGVGCGVRGLKWAKSSTAVNMPKRNHEPDRIASFLRNLPKVLAYSVILRLERAAPCAIRRTNFTKWFYAQQTSPRDSSSSSSSSSLNIYLSHVHNISKLQTK